MAEASTAAPTKPKRGFLSFLPLIAILLIVPVGGWFGLEYFKKKKAGAKTEGKAEEKGESAHGGGHGKEAKHTLHAPARLAMPITESPLVLVAGDPKNDVPARIVGTNAFKVNSIKPDKITIMFADATKKKHYAVTQIYLAGEDTEALLRKVNEKQALLFENVTNLLSAKMFRDTRKPGFRRQLRSEIIVLANQILETNLVQEVIIPEFITQ